MGSNLWLKDALPEEMGAVARCARAIGAGGKYAAVRNAVGYARAGDMTSANPLVPSPASPHVPAKAPCAEPWFCIVEDRPTAEIGIKLLVASLRERCPGARSVLFHACPSPGLTRWLSHHPDVRLEVRRLPGGGTADVKPHALLAMFELGCTDAIWIDTDMVMAGDPRPWFASLGPNELGISQEIRSAAHQGTAGRTMAWGMEVARSWPYTLNTCITRVVPAHAALLREWARLLEDPRYTMSLARPLQKRPFHAMFDLDVLNAMLGSREWADVPVHVFPAGEFVVHSGGAGSYSLGERLRGMFKPSPPIFHALAMKPWVLLDPAAGNRGAYWYARSLLQEISPFVAEARRHRAVLDDPCPWLDTRSIPGVILRGMGFGHFALRGLPVAALAALASVLGIKRK